jgi:UDP-3-O-[3-hydroxymyristoyl] glucosamine N-acyltransferase
MGKRLGELVERFGGELEGDPDIEVTAIASLEHAGPGDISFLGNGKLRALAEASRAAALILAPLDAQAVAGRYAGARIVTANPYAYFARAGQWLMAVQEAAPASGIHPSAVVHESARIDPTAAIGPHVTVEAGAIVKAGAVIDAGCYIGREAVVGEGTRLFANATFHARCVIGARGVVHSGAVIGGDGFGFAVDGGVYIKIPQVGRVVMGDDVDIGCNTTVDRGTMDDTVLGDGVKLDNLIQIGHNCQIGDHTAMAGCTGVAGSCKIGKHCTFGGASMINGHIEIVDHVHVSGATMVPNSILEPGRYTSFYPAMRHAEWERSAALLRNLVALRDRIRVLERTLKALARDEEAAKD